MSYDGDAQGWESYKADAAAKWLEHRTRDGWCKVESMRYDTGEVRRFAVPAMSSPNGDIWALSMRYDAAQQEGEVVEILAMVATSK